MKPGALAIVCVIAWMLVLPADALPKEVFAAPTPEGRDDGDGSFDKPIRIIDFWDDGFAVPGATLYLKSGVYTGADSLLRPRASFSGAPGSPITVRSLYDGGALIDGGGVDGPIRLQGDYWTVQGVNAANGYVNVVAIAGAHNVVRRVVAWDASPVAATNSKIFDIAGAQDALLEDVAGFGSGRKVFEVSTSVGVTIRRAWGRWEAHQGNGPNLTFSCTYGGYNVICENVLATVGGADPSPKAPTLIGMDHFDPDHPTPTGDIFESGLQVLGSIAYQRAGVPVSAATNIRFGNLKGAELIDIVSYAEPLVSETPTLFNLGNCDATCLGSEPPGVHDLALHLTQIGDDSPSTFKATWGLVANMDLVTAPVSAVPDIFTGSAGAEVCHRYVDGVLTSEPLWPWPMNARIEEATSLARGGIEGTDVTQEIQHLFGTIPAACRPPDGCGIGMELTFLLPPLMLIQNRQRRRAAARAQSGTRSPIV